MRCRAFGKVFSSPSMTSRAMRPSRLMVPPEILRRVTKERISFSDALVCSGMSGCSRTLSGVVTLFECGHVRPTLRFSGRPCTHGFPRGHCLASMGSNLCCGAVGLGWDEEVSDGGEDRHEMLQ